MIYVIQRKRGTRGEWKNTKHEREAESANKALRLFGCNDALKSNRVKVARSHKDPRTAYRAVPASIA